MLALIAEAKAAEANAPRDDHIQLAIELVSQASFSSFLVEHSGAEVSPIRLLARGQVTDADRVGQLT
jgi:hypothetical protein